MSRVSWVSEEYQKAHDECNGQNDEATDPDRLDNHPPGCELIVPCGP